MEDIEQEEKNKISIKIISFANTINKELEFTKSSDGKELIFPKENSEISIKTGEDLKNFIKNYLNIPYIKLDLIRKNQTILDDDEIIDIIPENEDLLSFIISKKEEEEDKKDKFMTIFLKTSKNIKEDKLTLEDEATLLNLKEKIKDLTNVEIVNQKIKFRRNEINDNNKKLKDFGIISNCTVQMEIIKEDNDVNIIEKFLLKCELKGKDFFEREEIILKNINNPIFGCLKIVFNIDEKLKDPKFKDLLFNPKYDSYLEASRGYILTFNETQLKDVMKLKDDIDDNLLNK